MNFTRIFTRFNCTNVIVNRLEVVRGRKTILLMFVSLMLNMVSDTWKVFRKGMLK